MRYTELLHKIAELVAIDDDEIVVALDEGEADFEEEAIVSTISEEKIEDENPD